MNDPRPDELLERCGRLFWRLNAAVAWTDGISDDVKAKTCSRAGSAAWKAAKRMREQVATEDGAAGYFKVRARRANPAVTASGSRWDLVEYDGDRDELDAKHGIPRLPETLGWQSRRGPHRVYLTPDGESPVKVQIDAAGIAVSTDGYLACAPAWRREHDVVYDLNGTLEPVALPDGLRALLLELGARTRTETRRRFKEGEEIPKGDRNVGIFWFAVDRLREGITPTEALERTLKAALEQCAPPLEPKRAREQFRGAVRFVAEHPTETERARAEARRILHDRQAGASAEPAPRQSQTKPKRRSVSRRPLREIAAERVKLLAGTPIPAGTLSLFAGIGGLGKSALALSYAKRVTDEGDAVLVISYEDAAGAVIRPRFEALGGDLDRLFVLEVDSLEGEVSFPADLPELDRHVRETEARLVIVDPVSASIDLKLDAHRDQDVRVVLGQLARLAERERFAALQIAHLNKAPGADPYFRINGSTAFYNASRLVMTVTPDKADQDWQRIVAAHKFNYGAVPDPERWRVEPVTIDTPAGPIDVMTLRFLEVADDVSREDVLAPTSMDKTDAAVVFLRDALEDGEWHDSLGLKALAGARRIAERTLKRAAAELEVEHERRGFPSTTWWRLPHSGHGPPPESGPTAEGA